jgi:SAM-dependent methyltransferase
MTEVKPWHEDDFFWETWGPVMFTERRLAGTATEVDGVVSLIGVRPGAHVLDLGCGIGRHSLELTRRGFKVTGVDRTTHYLKQANENAEKENLKVEFVQDDMRNFCRPDTFDAAISMFTSFSYFEDPEEDRQVIANVYRSLKPGGAFLLETRGKETMARIFSERGWHEENGTLLLEESRVTRNWGWMEARWIIIKDNKRTESRLSHRLYSATELIALLSGCGFSRADAYGDLEGNAYDHTARRLVVVGRK